MLLRVQEGQAIDRPATCSEEMFDLILKPCFNMVAENRPSFRSLAHKLRQMMGGDSVEIHRLSFAKLSRQSQDGRRSNSAGTNGSGAGNRRSSTMYLQPDDISEDNETSAGGTSARGSGSGSTLVSSAVLNPGVSAPTQSSIHQSVSAVAGAAMASGGASSSNNSNNSSGGSSSGVPRSHFSNSNADCDKEGLSQTQPEERRNSRRGSLPTVQFKSQDDQQRRRSLDYVKNVTPGSLPVLAEEPGRMSVSLSSHEENSMRLSIVSGSAQGKQQAGVTMSVV